MPANVTYEYIAAKEKYEKAKTNEEKLIALQEMLSKAPTHKGAENLRKDISRKIAAIKNKIEKRAVVQKKQGHTISIKKEGAGQVIIIGFTNSGKSTFLKEYTNAKPTIASYPYTTTKPEVGILNYGGARIQLVELPSFLESKEHVSQIMSLVRVADALVVVIRDNSFEEITKLLNLLEKQDVYINKARPKIKIIKSGFSGISFVNESNLSISKEKAIKLLKDIGFKSHTFVLNQKTNTKDLLLSINPRASYIPAIIVNMSNNNDRKSIKNTLVFSFKDKKNITEAIFNLLNKIIIYTKKPSSKVDKTQPLVLDRGSNVGDAAKAIHKNIFKDLKFARVWGSAKFDGQTVSKNYILHNRDIVEFVV